MDSINDLLAEEYALVIEDGVDVLILVKNDFINLMNKTIEII